MLAGLSAEEVEEIGREALAAPGFRKIQTLTPKISALRLDIANRDLIAGFDQRLDEAIQTAMFAKLEACER